MADKNSIETIKNNDVNNKRAESIIKRIEDWKNELNVSDAIFNGTKVSKGWVKGKETTQSEFELAIKKWLGADTGKGGDK